MDIIKPLRPITGTRGARGATLFPRRILPGFVGGHGGHGRDALRPANGGNSARAYLRLPAFGRGLTGPFRLSLSLGSHRTRFAALPRAGVLVPINVSYALVTV